MKRVRITFSVHGIVGRETYDVEPGRNPGVTEARALGAFEFDLIDAGFPTWECGCCVKPAGIAVIATEVLEDGAAC